MGKIQFCRICRSKTNLKFTTKQLREFNKNLLSAQETQGPGDKASQKLLRTTPTLGNICKDCDVRVQIFHRLDDGNQSSDSDIEIDVVDTAANSLPATSLLPILNNCRPDTPVIVDDDDMLYDLFMQKVDQQRQQRQLPAPIRQQQPQLEPQPQQQFISHFNSQYTPPQSTGGSEGDDSKILEVLTSRESTPASIATTVTIPVSGPPLPPDIVDNQGHRIVAIIDLDDGDEDPKHNNNERVVDPPQNAMDLMGPLNCYQNVVVAQAKFKSEPTNNSQLLLTPVKSTETQNKAAATCHSEDDEEIVFRRVEPHLETPPSKKKKRKSYDDKQLRLVASLSLVSSDSESEEPPTATVIPKCFSCKECHIHFPDQESLSVHERVHEGIKCPECHFGFPQEKRLVHHMRYKHRAYNGHVLMEKPRAPQDSAMTIRLRYMQRLTYYECQLCGRIDEVFKDHKDHIINKHPVESKSLKDPIMKQLKCPICKEKCGAQYLSLCRHLLAKHEYGQYKSHLRELLHVHTAGWNAAMQQEVFKTSRIYQFSKRNSFFFECKICHKVVAGYVSHLKHLNNHSKLEIKEKTEVKKVVPTTSTSNSKNITKKEKLGKIIESTKKDTKIILQKDSKSCKKSSAPVTKSQNLKKSLISKKSPIVVKLKKPTIKSKESLKRAAVKPIISKPKSTPIVKSTDKSNKRKRKENSSSKPQVKKVKVKAPAPIRQINLQTYTCSYCSKQIKGFLLYNTHVRQEHKHSEFEQCAKCHKTYLDKTQFKCHTEQCSKLYEHTNKQKRKWVSGDGNNSKDTDVNCNAKRRRTNNSMECCEQQKVPEIFKNIRKDDDDLPASEEEKEPLWLKDLLQLNESKNNSNSIDEDSSSTVTTTTAAVCQPPPPPPPEHIAGIQQCCYCLHLFASDFDLKDHTRLQHSRENTVLVRYTPFKAKF